MHLPCVLIFFAVATRPVGVGAHVTDDQFEVVRHLRVQERAHGKDKEERMNSLNLGGEEEISTSNLHNLVEKYRMEIPNFDLYKPSPTDIFLDKLLKLQETNSRPTYAFNTVMDEFNEEEMPMIFEEANERFAAENLDPPTVFKLYQLDLVGDTLFEQPQMVYWVRYQDFYSRRHADLMVPQSLLAQMDKFLSIETLVAAAARVPNDAVALRVKGEIKEFWWHAGLTPDDVFTRLDLEKVGYSLFVNHLFHFWTSYFSFYKSKKPETSNVSMLSLLKKRLEQPFLRDLLTKYYKSDATLILEEEMKSKLLRQWQNTGIQVNDVLQTAAEMKEEHLKTVFGSALQDAAIKYRLYKGTEINRMNDVAGGRLSQ
ncbi:unnamed protein product [Peronospora farinosa]|uniref:RxLR effector protein n=1 Tax=Peronospora farinosa TaxID=134698 RepID=A0AAV0SW47_9STRA|nr:unnamed protein product [Peronospora farinosa]CAI5709471.1 unnamed protein product [Peronospora farinosa]